MTAKAIKIKWFVLQFGTNHFVHKNLTKYILVSIGKHRKKRGKSGKKRPEFSSSPHRTERRRGDIFFSCSQKWTRKNPETVAASGFSGAISFLVAQCGCGDRTRTCDLRVMSPTSYQLLYSAISTKMVPVTGLEPVQHHCREILSLLCLPFHHTGSFSAMNRIPQYAGFCQGFVKKTFRRLSSPFAGAGKKEPLSEHRRAAQAGGILESFRDYDTPAGPACK